MPPTQTMTRSCIKMYVLTFRRPRFSRKLNAYFQRLRREYEVWGRAEHRNVLRLEGLLVCDILPSPGLVSEYKEHGDLLKFIQLKPTFDRLAMVCMRFLDTLYYVLNRSKGTGHCMWAPVPTRSKRGPRRSDPGECYASVLPYPLRRCSLSTTVVVS